MSDDRVFLKVKLKALAAEARIIRKEEKRVPSHQRLLWEHRTKDLRSEARHTLAAYGYLRGRALWELEPRHHEGKRPLDATRVRSMVQKYGAWLDGEGSKEKQLKGLDLWLKRTCAPQPAEALSA